MKDIHFVLTGGTLTMDHSPSGYRPEYDLRHLLTAVKIESSDLSEKEKQACYKQLTSLKISQNNDEAIDDALNNILIPLGARTVYHVMREYGVSPIILTPYQPLSYSKDSHVSEKGLLDSINFDFNTHFNALKNSALKALSKPHASTIILGGTDTLEFYASALTEELKKKDALKNNNAIFVSSMYTFEEHPAHIAGLVKGALEATKGNQKHSLEGAYVLAPKLDKNDNVTGVKLHDISSGLVKISSHLKDAFRSNNGIVDDITFTKEGASHHFNEQLTTSKKPSNSASSRELLTTAPPLIRGNSPHIVLSYLKTVLKQAQRNITPFEILPIENFYSLMQSPLSAEITSTIQELALHNVRVAFFQDMKINKQHDKHFTLANIQPISPENNMVKALEPAGTLFLKGPTNQLYTQLRFGNDPLPEITLKASDNVDKHIKNRFQNTTKQLEPIRIKYIPDQTLFKPMLELAANISSHIVIEALPGQTLPDFYQETLTKLIESGTQISVGFKYNGKPYSENGKTFIEGKNDLHGYAASKWLKDAGVTICGDIPPSEISPAKEATYNV